MRELRTRGFDARQRFCISELSYRSAKSPPARFLLRIRQYFVYPVRLVFILLLERLFKRQSTVCVVSTNTFYAPLLATLFHPNVVHLVYDLFPEAMICSGKWQAGSLKTKCVRWIIRNTLRRVRQNVFLGQRLRNYVELQYRECPNATVIEVGADQTLFEQDVTIKPETFEEIEILYCGNFGNLHDSATVFEYWNKAAEKVDEIPTISKKSPQHITWKFHCSGPKRTELLAICKRLPGALERQVQIGASLSQTEWIAALEKSDIALVTMTPGAETVVMPSKAYSAMMAGQAVLAIAPDESDLVDTIKAASCGWWVNPGDAIGLEQVLAEISANPEAILEKRRCARSYSHQHFGQDVLAVKWCKLFAQLDHNDQIMRNPM